MKVRIASALLWFFVGWSAGAILAWLFGVSPILGPILGTATAAVMAGDPRQLIWKDRPATTPSQATVLPERLPESN